MADTPQPNEQSEDRHFTLIFRYILSGTIAVLTYVILITFVPIPKENQRFVDIALAFLLGWMSGNSQYLTGGNPNSKKPDTQVSVTGDNQQTTVVPSTPTDANNPANV